MPWVSVETNICFDPVTEGALAARFEAANPDWDKSCFTTGIIYTKVEHKKVVFKIDNNIVKEEKPNGEERDSHGGQAASE